MERIVVDSRYVLVGLLGGGGMGKVYLARDEVLDRDVALKVLREQYAEDWELVERFEREAKASASLNHPNIVSVYDRGRTAEGSYYIAMEHVPGGTLKDLILKEGSMEAAEALRLTSQVADALGVAHASGIVHRDVKPHNVLLTAAGDAKVADFGIARAASKVSLSNSSRVLGTATYMSPEQAMGDPLGPESDLYSLGVVLYEMLTGKVPFEADSSVGVAMKHVTEPPRPPREKDPEVPEGLNAVVLKLLQKKPEDRYSDAAELVADLSRLEEGLAPVFAASRSASGAETTQALTQPLAPAPVHGNPGGAHRGFVRSPRRRRARLLAAVLVALLVLLGMLGVGLSQSSGGSMFGSVGKAVEEAEQALSVGEREVPKVVGLTEEEARGRLAEQGFGVAVERRKSAAEDEGRVVGQSVPSGQEARRGSRIALAVGGGPRTVKVPNIVGMTPGKAQTKIDEAGLKLGGRKEAPSADVAAGEVSAQDPAAGKEAKVGTEVELTVSSGPPAASQPHRVDVDVPDVSGLSVDEATTILRAAGCELAGTKTETSPEPEGTVIGTDPPMGTAVASGTPVILVVSGGPGAPPAGDPSGGPAAQPATASPDASASPKFPSKPAPSAGPRADDPQPSSQKPTPSPPEPTSPEPTSPEPTSPEPTSPEPTSPGAAAGAAPPSTTPSPPSVPASTAPP
jgi:eukaryotic-like serine/threonine-protein kinase